MNETDKRNAIEVLNKTLELELAGVVRYTHYALMVFGYNRIPIVSWLQGNADESLMHARKAGEFVTMHPDRARDVVVRPRDDLHRRREQPLSRGTYDHHVPDQRGWRGKFLRTWTSRRCGPWRTSGTACETASP